MNILAVTPYYPPEGGGLERYAHETLAHIARAGHSVTVLAATKAARTREVHDGVQVQFYKPSMHLGNAPVQPGLSRRLRRMIRDRAADLVVAHAPVPFPAEAASRAARKEGVPFVLTYHAGRMRGSSAMLDAMAAAARATTQPMLFRRSDHLIAVSPFVRDTALRGHEARTTVVPPGVDTTMFRPGAATDPREILFVGPLDRSYRWKGVDVLCRAFERLRCDGVEARLRLVGSGDRLDEFSAWADRRSDVRVEARLPMNCLVEAFQEAGVLVLPSTTDAEAFGMVLAEANACGRPVIGARIGGIPDFIQAGRNGELVRPGDADDLADRLEAMLASPDRMDKMGRWGRRLVEREHAWPLVGRRTERVLASVA